MYTLIAYEFYGVDNFFYRHIVQTYKKGNAQLIKIIGDKENVLFQLA